MHTAIRTAVLIMVGVFVFMLMSSKTEKWQPSEIYAKQVVSERIIGWSEDRIEMSSFKKTDGYFRNRVYVMEFEGVFVFKKDCYWHPGSVNRPVVSCAEAYKRGGATSETSFLSIGSQKSIHGHGFIGLVPGLKGDTLPVSGTAIFSYTKEGKWALRSVEDCTHEGLLEYVQKAEEILAKRLKSTDPAQERCVQEICSLVNEMISGDGVECSPARRSCLEKIRERRVIPNLLHGGRIAVYEFGEGESPVVFVRTEDGWRLHELM